MSAPAAPARTNAVWRLVGRSTGVRIALLAIGAVAGIVITRLIVDHFGKGAYAQYTLLVGLGQLFPFVDLGMSAAVINVVAGSENPARDPQVRSVVRSAIRVLVGSTGVVLVAVLVVTLGGWWPAILGDGLLPGSGPLAAGLSFAIFALTIPLGVGQRVLVGLGRNLVPMVSLGMLSPLVLVAVLGIVAFAPGLGDYVAVVAFAIVLLLAVVTFSIAVRAVRPVVGLAVRQVHRLRTVRGESFRTTAWPALVQSVAIPLALQTDRIVLSHRSDVTQLASYSLAAQIFAPVSAVLYAIGVVLWPVFARQRAGRTDDVPSPFRMAAVFGVAGLVVAAALGALTPLLTAAASGGAITVPVAVVATFVAFAVVQAVKLPLGSFLTDADGLRFQAWGILLLLPANLGLSWWLAGAIGAQGPILASVLTVAVFQLAPTAWEVRRRHRAGS